MKKYLLILPFLVACSTSKNKVIERDVASSQPARTIKIISPNENSFAIDKTPRVDLKFYTYKFGTSPARGREVEFSLIKGEGSFSKAKVFSDTNGLVLNSFVPKKQGDYKLKIKVDRIEKLIDFYVTRPSTFQGSFSVEDASFEASINDGVADGKSKIIFSVQMRDSSSMPIDAYGLKLKLIEGSNEYDFNEIGSGRYEVSVPVGTKSGRRSFYFSANDKRSSLFQNIDLSPEIRFFNSSLSYSTLEDGRIKVSFVLRDLNGDNLESISQLNIKPLISSKKGSASKIFKEEKISRFYYLYTPPKGKGNTALGLALNGKEYFTTNSIGYDYDPIVISKLELKVEDRDIPPTGADHLLLWVKAYDANGKLVKIPKDKKVFDLEVEGCAKLYDLIQGEDLVYSPRLIPSKNCKKAKVTLLQSGKVIDEKELTFDFKPKGDKIKLEVHFGGRSSIDDIDMDLYNTIGWKPRSGISEGFSISNDGVNSIIPEGCTADADPDNGYSKCQASRQFSFEYHSQARQNIVLQITDEPSNFTSHLMETRMFFFPRKVLPQINYSDDRSKIIMTLPTGEEVEFDAKTKQIVGGVMDEGPIDMGPSRHSRKFATVRYKGSGVALRINGRGQDPRLGQFNPAKISGDYGNTGGKDVLIYKFDENTQEMKTCYGKKSDFWPQKDINPIPFNMFTDEQFDAYLKKNCDFSL